MEMPAAAQLLAEAAARTCSVMGSVDEVCWTDKGTLTVRKLASLMLAHPLNTDAAKNRMLELQSVHTTTPVLFHDPAPQAPLASLLIIPLLTPEGRTLGTLTLANRTENSYGSADLLSVEDIRRSLVTLLADHRTSQFAVHLQKDVPLFEALFARVGSAELVRLGNVAPDVSSVMVEAELRRFVSEAKEALQLKLRFLRNLNQELRLPLNGILGVANLLYSGNRLGTEDAQYVTTIVESAELLISLLEGLPDSTAFASQTASPTPTPASATTPSTPSSSSSSSAPSNNPSATPVVPAARLGHNLCELLEDVAGAFSYAAETKGLELIVDVDTRLPTHVVIDAPKLRQLLFYALCHAVRSLKAGLLTLSASSKSGAKKPEVIIEISVLAQSTTDHKLEPTEGVGMHLARTLSASLNAKLEENLADASLSHVLTLPALMDVDQSRAFALGLKELSERVSGLSILVLIRSEHVLNVLRRYGYGLALKKITYASSLSDAQAMKGTLDVAIIDFDMLEEGGLAIAETARYAVLCKQLILPTPVMPPFSAHLNRPVRRVEFFTLLASANDALAAKPNLSEPPAPAQSSPPSPAATATTTAQATTPTSPPPSSLPPSINASPVESLPAGAISLSSSSLSLSSRRSSTGGGLSSSTTLSLSAVLPTTSPLTSPSSRSRPTTPPLLLPSSPSGPLKPANDTRKILVVDDNPSNLKLASSMVHTFGWETDIAEDGAQAVEAATKNTYAMILMDLMMPTCDGLDAARRIRAMEKALGRKPVPIIAHTAQIVDSLPLEQSKITEAGMDDVCAKPLKRERLKEILTRYCIISDTRP